MSDEAEQRGGVAAVDRALSILEVFRPGERSLPLAQIAQRTGLYKSTILRLDASLERAGYMVRLDDGHWRLGPALSRLGSTYQSAFNLRDYIEPTLQRLVDRCGETAAFYIRDGNVRVCLFRAEAKHSVRHHINVGQHLPLERGGPARVLRAFTGGDDEISEQVRRDFYFFSAGERDPETSGVAVPVMDSNGLCGAMAVIGPTTRMTSEVMQRYLGDVLQASVDVSIKLGGDVRGLQAAIQRQHDKQKV